ncbi:MAG: hypothetical protein J7K23_00380 [Thermoproteales archaeon]|nr:hypothetical protein [Thermoproteales archaeon]
MRRSLSSAYYILELARLGDAIVNYIFSACFTLFLKKPSGVRAKNSILRRVFKESKIADVFGVKRLPSGVEPEDFIEAVVALLWLEGKINVEKAVEYIVHVDEESISGDLEYLVADRLIKYILSMKK